MALDNAKNFAKVTVSTGYDAVATSIVLTTGHGAKLPTAPFNAVWWNSTDYADPADDPNVEIVRVTAISTDTLTITRAQESTSASTKNTASKTYKMIAGLTAKVINTDLPVGSLLATIFETAARFSSAASGGTNTFNTAGLSMSVSTSSSTAGVVAITGANDNVFAGSPMMMATFRQSSIGTAGFFFIGVGTVTSADPIVSNHFGFRVSYTAGPTATLYATQADGSTENKSSALTTLATNDVIEVCARMNGTSSIDYYWRKNGGAWSAATNLTANMPSSDTNWINVELNNAATTASTTVIATGYSYRR